MFSWLLHLLKDKTETLWHKLKFPIFFFLRWNLFHSLAFLIPSFHSSWKLLTWEVLCGWLNTLKTETIFPTSMSNLTPSQLPRLTATPPTSCLPPSLSGIYQQVLSFIPNVKCMYFFPSSLSLSLFLRSIQQQWQLWATKQASGAQGKDISKWGSGDNDMLPTRYICILLLHFHHLWALPSGDLLFFAPCCIRSTSSTAWHIACAQ